MAAYCKSEVYASALPWDEKEEKQLLKEVTENDILKTITTPVHKMYAKVARLALNQRKKMMVFDKNATGLIIFYNLHEDDHGVTVDQLSRETLTCDLLTSVRDFALATIENRVYISGGFDVRDESPVNALIVYDGYTGEWRLLSGMRKNRCNHTMVHWKGRLLVTGGEINAQRKLTSTCELYNPETDKWVLIDPLPEPRYCHACVVHDESVFISGGLCTSHHPQTSIWVYEKTSSRWMSLDEDYPVELPYRLAKHSMISHYDTIYIIGGLSKKEGERSKSTSEIISFKPLVSYLGKGALCDNIERNKYDRVTPWSHDHKHLPEPLRDAVVQKQGNDIIVLGGCSDISRNEHIITYSMEHNTTRTSRLLSKSFPRNMLTKGEGVLLEKTSRKSLEQLVPRNWPLW